MQHAAKITFASAIIPNAILVQRLPLSCKACRTQPWPGPAQTHMLPYWICMHAFVAWPTPVKGYKPSNMCLCKNAAAAAFWYGLSDACAHLYGCMLLLTGCPCTCACLQVAIKTARGRQVSSNPDSYQYDEFLQVEWQAHQRMMIASPGPSTGFPHILAAGKPPVNTELYYTC